jgi:hypothetical protein
VPWEIKRLLFIGHKEKSSIFSVLPIEIIKEIIQFLRKIKHEFVMDNAEITFPKEEGEKEKLKKTEITKKRRLQQF